jgi:uncharacterized protein (DUF427 family)
MTLPPGLARADYEEVLMSKEPPGRVRVEHAQKRVRTYLGGDLVADCRAPLLVWENPRYPAYYFPPGDVLAELIPVPEAEQRPRLGAADVFDVKTPSSIAKAAARRFPSAPAAEIRDAIRLEWTEMSEWFEEDEPVYTHPRDPYTRVDILASSRLVRIELDGVVAAESDRPRILFETGLPPRYYMPITDLRMGLLRPSNRNTHCPYKGTAGYWSVDTSDAAPGGHVHADIVWIYRTPLPESQKIAGLACFYNERVDLYLDGEKQPRPITPFSEQRSRHRSAPA